MSLDPGELRTAAHLSDPAPLWRRLRDEHPLWHDPEADVYVVSRYDDVAEVLRDHETYSISTYAGATGAVLGPTLIQMDGPEHVWRRSAVAPDFVGTRLEGWRPVLDATLDRLLGALPRGGAVDIVTDLSTHLPVEVIVAMLGLDGDPAVFHGWVKDIMAGLAPIPERRERGRAAFASLCRHIDPLLDDPEGPERNDLVAKIARASSAGRSLDHDEVRAFAGLLFIAGGETTDKAFGNLWFNLLTHPEALEAVRTDPELLHPALNETMRRDAPVVSEDRFATCDVEVHGQVVPAGARVRALIGSAHLDHAAFDAPEQFRLDRTDLHLGVERRSGVAVDGRRGHLGFGLGKHFCLGYQLARMEIVEGSRRLLDRLVGVRLADPDQRGPVLIGSMRALASLPVRHDGD